MATESIPDLPRLLTVVMDQDKLSLVPVLVRRVPAVEALRRSVSRVVTRRGSSVVMRPGRTPSQEAADNGDE